MFFSMPYLHNGVMQGIKRDLDYVVSNWQLATGDPWEEIRGPVFFAKIAARKVCRMFFVQCLK